MARWNWWRHYRMLASLILSYHLNVKDTTLEWKRIETSDSVFILCWYLVGKSDKICKNCFIIEADHSKVANTFIWFWLFFFICWWVRFHVNITTVFVFCSNTAINKKWLLYAFSCTNAPYQIYATKILNTLYF